MPSGHQWSVSNLVPSCWSASPGLQSASPGLQSASPGLQSSPVPSPQSLGLLPEGFFRGAGRGLLHDLAWPKSSRSFLGLQKNIETAADLLQFWPKWAVNELLFSVTFASWGPGVVQGGPRLVPRDHFGGILGPMGRSSVLKWGQMGCQSGAKRRFGSHLGSP